MMVGALGIAPSMARRPAGLQPAAVAHAARHPCRKCARIGNKMKLVPRARFELARPFGRHLLRMVCLPFHHLGNVGRDSRIRTCGFVHPMHARYRAALYPEIGAKGRSRTRDARCFRPALYRAELPWRGQAAFSQVTRPHPSMVARLSWRIRTTRSGCTDTTRAPAWTRESTLSRAMRTLGAKRARSVLRRTAFRRFLR